MVRKAVKELISSEKKSVKASANNLAEYLGVPKYRYGGEVEGKDLIGVVIGFAWTDVGGRVAHHRSRHDARQGPHDGDRQPARR